MTADVLGRTADAKRYAALADQIRAAFEKRFYHSTTSTYGSGRQVTSVLPLAFDLTAPANRSAIAAALRRRIEDTDHRHLDTGIFGTRYLFEVLIDHGFTDLAHQVLTNPGYPGYVDQIEQGATTTWEQWSFRGSMQTHNHAMFSGPDATFFSHFGGIRPAAPGFREIVIRPALSSAMAFVECSRVTPVGKISCHWSQSAGLVRVRVSVPVNTTAHVHIPAREANRVLESGRPAKDAAGVRAVRAEDGFAIFSVGSGDYEFTTTDRAAP
jgi:alpha-L-rhamnosidase